MIRAWIGLKIRSPNACNDMNKILHHAIILYVACLLAGNTPAETDSDAVQCVKAAGFLAPPGAGGQLNYAPDREVTPASKQKK